MRDHNHNNSSLFFLSQWCVKGISNNILLTTHFSENSFKIFQKNACFHGSNLTHSVAENNRNIFFSYDPALFDLMLKVGGEIFCTQKILCLCISWFRKKSYDYWYIRKESIIVCFDNFRKSDKSRSSDSIIVCFEINVS